MTAVATPWPSEFTAGTTHVPVAGSAPLTTTTALGMTAPLGIADDDPQRAGLPGLRAGGWREDAGEREQRDEGLSLTAGSASSRPRSASASIFGLTLIFETVHSSVVSLPIARRILNGNFTPSASRHSSKKTV